MSEKEEWQLEQLHNLREFGTKIMKFKSGEAILVEVDEYFCHMLGYSKRDLMMRCRGKMRELVVGEDYPAIYVSVNEQLFQKGSYTCRYRMKRKGGSIWVWESGSKFKDENGNELVRATVINMSDEEMTRLERDMTYENIPGGAMTVLATSDNFYITKANNQYFDMVGTTREEYLGSSGIYTFQQDLPGLRAHIVEQAGKHQPIDYEFRTRHPVDQSIRWYRMVGRYYQQTVEGREYLCVLLDITERKQNIFQLEKEKERYRIAMGITANILFEYDMGQKVLQLYLDTENDSFRLCLDETTHGDWKDIIRESQLIHKDDIYKLAKFYEQNYSMEAEIRLLTETIETGEKSYQWYAYVATKVVEGGKTARIVGSVKNIEEHKRKEQEKLELTHIFDVEMNKIYELIMLIHVKDGIVQGYFTHGMSYDRVYSSQLFEDYVIETANRFVRPDEKVRFMDVFQLDSMLQVLNSSELEEVLFFQLKRESQEYRYKCFRYSYLGNDTDTILITVQDVHEIRTQQLKMEDADRRVMEAAMNEAKETVEVRRNFIAMLAREVQAPIRYINTMLQKPDSSQEIRMQMQHASQYALSAVENMADYEKINRGDIHIVNTSFSINYTMEQILDQWVGIARKKNIEIECNNNFYRDGYYGDVEQFKKAVDNILGNCIRNSEPYTNIRLWMSDEQIAPGVTEIMLIVEDHGIMIGDGFFGRQYPLDEEDNYVVEPIGTRFSLILARRIVEYMGGRLQMRRERGNTNVIEFTVPMQHGQNQDSDRGETTQKENEKSKDILKEYKLLVVEDNSNPAVRMIAPIFKVNGAIVDVAFTGKDGIELWNSYPEGTFDAIIVEGFLPDMDYVTFTTQLRKQRRKEAREIVVVALVEDLRQENVTVAMKAGVNTVLEKPLRIERIKQILDFTNKRSN